MRHETKPTDKPDDDEPIGLLLWDFAELVEAVNKIGRPCRVEVTVGDLRIVFEAGQPAT